MRSVLTYTLIGFTALLGGCNKSPSTAGRDAPLPDVLLISVDTLRADHLGCYGWADAKTPTIDALAADGVLFESATTTVPITLPAHASLLTGLIPPRHGVRDNGTFRLSDQIQTVAEALQAHGYQTGAFIGAQPLQASGGLTQGFDHYDDQMPLRSLARKGAAQRPERGAEEVVTRAAQWTNLCATDKPVFAFVHFYDPHSPYQQPAEGATEGSYDGEIAYVDRALRTLLDTGFAGRDAANRLTIITSDHGEGLGEHREETHCIFCYESTLRIPLILHGQGLSPQRLTGPVGIIDVAPTLLQLVGLDPLDDCDGVSLVEQINAGQTIERDLYFESLYGELRFGWAPLRGIRRGSMKFIDAPRPELYELEADPGELSNTYEEGLELVGELADLLDEIGAGVTEQGQLDDESIRALSSLGYVSARPAAGATAAKPDPKDRIEVYQRFQLAHQLALAGSVADALHVMADLEVPFSESPYFFLEWGNLASMAGDWERSRACYERCLNLDPEHVEAGLNLAVAQIQLNDHAGASDTLRLLLQRVPEHAKAHLYAGVCARELGELEKTRNHWRRFVELAPDDPEAAKIRAALSAPN